MNRFIRLLTAGAACLFAHAASATISYQFTADVTYGANATGPTATAQVYLTETVTGADTSRLLAESGLFSAGVRVERDPASTLDVMLLGITAAPAFNDPQAFSSQSGADFAQFSAAILAPPFVGPTGDAVAAGVRRVLLGEFRYQLPSTGTGAAIFRVVDKPNTDDTFTNAGTPLDGQIQRGAFNVLIPEPAGAALFLFALPLVCRRVRPRQS